MKSLAFTLLCLVSVASASAQVDWKHLSSTSGDLPAPVGSSQQTACVVADFNQDGIDDPVVASRVSQGKVEIWLSSPGGMVRHTIEPSNVSPEAGGTAFDIDFDGDIDLVLGQDLGGSEIYWWENPYPTFGSAWTRRLIKSGGGSKHHDQAHGDVDGDGKIELLSWTQGAKALHLFEVPANPQSAGVWTKSAIYSSSSSSFEGLVVADIDGDGVDDIAGAGRWWRHQGGGVFLEEVIDGSKTFTRVAVGQLISGGRPEVVFVPGDADGSGYYYEWNGSTWIKTLFDSFLHGHTLDIADLDGDGHLDIFAGEMKLGSASCELRVYYGDGAGGLQKQVVSVGNGIHEGRLGDLDGDGDLDIVHKPYNDGTPRLDLWMNEQKVLPLDQWKTHLIATLPTRAVFVRAGDLDGDGDGDIVAGPTRAENPGSPSGVWPSGLIGGPLYNIAAVHDFDGDGDLDLFGTQGVGSGSSASFAWGENLGGQSFQIHTNIQSGSGDFLQGCVVERFGGPTAPIQIALSWHASGHGVQILTVPAQPTTQTWTWAQLHPTSLSEDLSAGDIDGDGDPDLLQGTSWLENPSWTAHVLGMTSDLSGSPLPDRNSLADIDGDGDLDAVVGLEGGQEILWFENPLPGGAPTGGWTRHILGLAAGEGFSMDVADFDHDGDPDVVVGEHKGTGQNRVLLFENPGQPTGWPMYVVDAQSTSVIDHHDGTQAVDIDADGDLDIVSTGWNNQKIWLFENLAVGGGGSGPTKAKPPAIDHAGAFRGFRRVGMTPGEPGADVRYTTDGTEPDASSTLYQGVLTLGDSTEVRAKTFHSTLPPSDTTVAHCVRAANELHYWRFDEAAGALAIDDAADPIHGTLVTPQRTIGYARGALDFDGVNDRVEVGTFDVSGSELSISAWIRADSFSHLAYGDSRVISKAIGLQEKDHTFMLSTFLQGSEVRLRFRLRVSGSTKTLIAGTGAIPVGQWVHVAATYDGAQMSLYQDGQPVGTLSAGGSITSQAGASVWIGDAPPSGQRPFDGLIDDVRLFERALAPSEVAAFADDVPPAGITPYGASTPGCESAKNAEALRSAVTGDADFGLCCSGAPTQTLGFLLISGKPDPVGTWIDSVQTWVSFGPAFFTAWPVTSDSSGRFLLSAPLTAVPAGIQAYSQFAWIDLAPPCPGNGFSASDAIEITVLPAP